MKTRVIFLIVLMVQFAAGYPDVIIVPDQQPTIQDAISVATTGDTVLVNPGTYPECIDFSGKNIVVSSAFITTGDTAYISQTIIDADGQGSAVTFANGESPEARLIGITLTNGTGTPVSDINHGGGIYCINASPTLEHLRVVNNSASGMGSGVGGGVYFNNSQAALKHSFIIANSAYYGGGVRVDNSDVTIENTWFGDNYAVGSGAGLMFYQCPSSLVTQSVFTGNQSIYGGAICCNGSNPVLDRITCYKNRGLYGGSLDVGPISMPTVINSIFWRNAMHTENVNELYIEGYGAAAMIAYTDIEGGQDSVVVQSPGTLYWMEGNINAYPLFADSTNLNLNLQNGSPCIDQGKALYVYNGDTIVNIPSYLGLAPDMGAYEYNPITSVHSVSADQSDIDFQILTEPGNHSIILRFEVLQVQQVMLAVYDMQGRIVEKKENRLFPQGKYDIPIQTASYKSGIYLISLISGKNAVSKKFAFIL